MSNMSQGFGSKSINLFHF